eukprot:1585726-Pyramimonas_sp.AAC.1
MKSGLHILARGGLSTNQLRRNGARAARKRRRAAGRERLAFNRGEQQPSKRRGPRAAARTLCDAI